MDTKYGGAPAGAPGWEKSGFVVEAEAGGFSWRLGRGETPCPNPMKMDRVHRKTGEVGALWKPCGRATCPACGPALSRSQSAWYTTAFEGRQGLKLCAFTLDPGVVRTLGSSAQARRYLSHTFGASLRPRLSRRCKALGLPLAYVAATERHLSGSPHVHALLECDLPEAIVRAQAFEAGFGASMSTSPVAPDRASVGGAVRYVLKSAFGQERPPGERAVWASKGLGYYGKRATSERRQYAEGRNGSLGGVDYVFEPAYDRVSPRRRPQGLSDEDIRVFADLRAGRRQTRFIERSADRQRGVRHVYGDAAGGYRADAVIIQRAGDEEDIIVVAENVSPEDARRHLADDLF